MRTTLDIDDDVLAAAKELAKAEGKTAGRVLSDLARRALTAAPVLPPGMAEGQQAPFGDDLWVTFPRRSGVVTTSEHVRRVEDEIDEEEVQRALAFARGLRPE
jgi:hypothetical protein